jgi:translation initiation factor 6
MKLFKTNLQGNPNVGLYGFCTNTYCLLAPEFTEKQVKTIKEVLDVPVYQMRISNTSLLGALLAGNSRMLLVPNIVYKEELEQLDGWKIPYTVVPSKLTALGNNILCNDRGALVNPDYGDAAKKVIQDALSVQVQSGIVADVEVCGSCAVHNPQAVVLHAFALPDHVAKVKKLLGVPVIEGTVNFGSPYVHSGVFANAYGMVMGDKSTALEIENIYEALGFLDDA